MPTERTLSMVATPIGNLGDWSPRAKETLAQAEVVFCEDTRMTRALLERTGVEGGQGKVWIRADDALTEQGLQQAWEQALERDATQLVFVSDAGTPGLSDPGARLVRLARATEGVRVEVVPGPSAVAAFISLLGRGGARFRFHGFFPRKKGDQDTLWKELSKTSNTLEIFFESPHRIEDTLEYLELRSEEIEYLAVAKELTKLYEWSSEGSVEEVLRATRTDPEQLKGEWVFGVRIKEMTLEEAEGDSRMCLQRAVRCLNAASLSTSDAVRILVQEFGVPRNEVYEEVLKLKQKK